MLTQEIKDLTEGLKGVVNTEEALGSILLVEDALDDIEEHDKATINLIDETNSLEEFITAVTSGRPIHISGLPITNSLKLAEEFLKMTEAEEIQNLMETHEVSEVVRRFITDAIEVLKNGYETKFSIVDGAIYEDIRAGLNALRDATEALAEAQTKAAENQPTAPTNDEDEDDDDEDDDEDDEEEYDEDVIDCPKAKEKYCEEEAERRRSETRREAEILSELGDIAKTLDLTKIEFNHREG